MAKGRADYTLTFRGLVAPGKRGSCCSVPPRRKRRPGWRSIAPAWQARATEARRWTRSIPNMSCGTGWRKPRSGRWKTAATPAPLDRILPCCNRPMTSSRKTRNSPPRRRRICAVWKSPAPHKCGSFVVSKSWNRAPQLFMVRPPWNHSQSWTASPPPST